jgi:MFS family permease
MERRDIRNFSLNVGGEILWGFQAALIGSSTVLAVLLRDLGAGPRMIGSILAIESGGFLLPQILGNYVFASRRKLKAHLMIFHFIVILPLLWIMAALTHFVFLRPEVFRWLLLASFAVYMISIGVVSSAWFDWFARLFRKETRGTVMGATWCAAAGAGAGGALLAGWTLDVYAPEDAYFALYVAAAVISVMSILLFCFVDDSAAQDEPGRRRVSTAALLQDFRHSLQDRNFRSYLIGRMLAVCGFCVLPLLVVYYTSPRGGGLDKGDVVSYGSAMTVGASLAHFLIGRLGDKKGYRVGLLIASAAQMATLGLLLLTSGPYSCLAAYFGAGLCGGASWISHLNMLFETCPHENRMAHITVGNMVISGAWIAAPLLAGQAAESFGVRSVFAVCLGVSAVAFLWFLRRVKDPRVNVE